MTFCKYGLCDTCRVIFIDHITQMANRVSTLTKAPSPWLVDMVAANTLQLLA